MTIPQQPQHDNAQYQDPGPELDSPSALAPHLRAPPPQFGRLPHTTPLREPFPAQVPQIGSSSQIPQPESLPGLGARLIIFLIDYVVPVIVLILLLCLGARTGSMASHLVLAVVGVGLLGCAVWNWRHRRGAPGRSLGRQVVRMIQHRKPARRLAR